MFIGQIYPQFVFDPIFDISIALMAFLGGLGTLVGPLLGALILESLQQYLTVTYSNGSLYLILFGSLFLLVILFMPQGIVVYVRDRMTNRVEREKSAVASNETDLDGYGAHMSELLRAEGISKAFGGVQALNNCTLSIRKGQHHGPHWPERFGKDDVI